ncbi:MAG: tRNA pseudouridine(38-40) synthase TruA [Peptococcaceae bacterium]
MRNIKAVVQYDGSRYYGFQAQLDPDNIPTVQEVLEEAIGGLLKEPTRVHSAGRTDSGVHALGQVVHFYTESRIPVDKLANAINQHLPQDVYILSTEEVSLEFHSRKCALGKHYQYKVWNSDEITVFGNQYFYRYPGKLDDNLMLQACKLLEGTHNYQGFCSAGSTVKNFVRTVYYMHMRRDGDWLIFDVYGNGFLYNMVRIMVGTVLDIGKGRKPLHIIPVVLDNQKRHLAGRTAPASGLYLKSVFYP